jgi:regulatory protein
MKITSISAQKRDNNRVNISVDGKYRFSLGISQLIDLGIKVGRDYDDNQLMAFEQESQFGKVYGRTLEYCLMRPHSAREVQTYLYRKTRQTRDKTGQIQTGIAPEITERVYNRLVGKKYIDDNKFCKYWVDNRSLKKGVSQRKLTAELRAKGISSEIINQALNETDRNDSTEIQKIIVKKRAMYPDDQKLIAYLARQGFSYDDIKQAIAEFNDL